MAVEKRNRDQPLVPSTRNVRARLFFKMYDHHHHDWSIEPNSPYFPPILKRSRLRYTKSMTPLKLITSRVNLPPHDYVDASSPTCSPSPEKTLKIIMPYESNHSVRFHSKVSVVRIPSRKHYSDSMKRSMWASLQEITDNARRNTIEFSSDGWDWRTATEEEDMYIHPRTGGYVHPVHVNKVVPQVSMSPPSSKSEEDVEEERPSQEESTQNEGA